MKTFLSLILMSLTLGSIALAFYYRYSGIHNMHKPNNQYEILIYEDHFELMNGKRLVAICKWEGSEHLQHVIDLDNQ